MHIVQDNDNIITVAEAKMMDDYAKRALLIGKAFNADASEVHTYIVNFISGNEIAESKILAIAGKSNGRFNFKVLQDYYEGVRINSIVIKEADKVIKNLQYTRERCLVMLLDKFKRRLTMSCNMHGKKKKHQVYSDKMKLRILCWKVNTYFLELT